MTAVTVQDVLNYNETSDGEPVWILADEIYNKNRTIEIEGLGTVTQIEVEGGEGEGDHYHVVFSITNALGETTNFRKEGHYSSYDGVDWDYGDFFEAFPVSRTVIDWGRKKED